MKFLFLSACLMSPLAISAQQTAIDDDFHLNTILFERNADLTPVAKQQLEQLGMVIETDFLSDTCYLLSGHSDASGSVAINQTVSEARALAVKDFILSSVDTADVKIKTIGFGEERLLPDTPATSQLNRRVVVMAQVCS